MGILSKYTRARVHRTKHHIDLVPTAIAKWAIRKVASHRKGYLVQEIHTDDIVNLLIRDDVNTILEIYAP